MTTRRRALVRAGVVMALAAGGLLAVGSPAYADNVAVTVDSHLAPFNPGDAQPLKITVSGGGASSVTVSVSGLSNFTAGNAQGCDQSPGSSCTVTFGPGDTSKTISFTLTATGSAGPGQSKTDHGVVSARQNALLGGSATARFDVTLQGLQQTQPQTQTVAQVSGVVTDTTTGSPIPNAVVVLVDAGACASGKNPCQVGTDTTGAFTFTPTPDKPITPGTLQIRATKYGYADATLTVAARAGRPVTVSLALTPTAAASASASPEALPSAEGLQPTADAVTSTAAGIAPAPAGDSRPSTLSWTVLVLAGLLVVAGVGVLAVMFLHRRKVDVDSDRPPGSGDVATVAGARHDHSAANRVDPTMLGNPAMSNTGTAPEGSDATAIIRPRRPQDDLPEPYPAADTPDPASYPQVGNAYDAPVDLHERWTVGYEAGQAAGYDRATQEYGGVSPTYGQGGDHCAGAAYDAPPATSGADHSYGSGDGAHDGTWTWDDVADGGDTGGGDYPQQGGHGPQDGVWARRDQAYPWDKPGTGDPYRQSQPTEAPPGRDASPAGQGGQRRRVDWFGN